MPTRALYDAVAGTVLTAVNTDTLAKGWCGYVESTGTVVTVATTPLTVLTLGVPVLAARRLRLTFTAFRADLSVAADSYRIHFTYDGVDAGGYRIRRSATTEEDGLTVVRYVATVAAGTKTVTVVATRTGGTGTLTLAHSAADPHFLLVEDIGPA